MEKLNDEQIFNKLVTHKDGLKWTNDILKAGLNFYANYEYFDFDIYLNEVKIGIIEPCVIKVNNKQVLSIEFITESIEFYELFNTLTLNSFDCWCMQGNDILKSPNYVNQNCMNLN